MPVREKQSERRGRGRPTKKATPGTRVSLGLKVTPHIKTKLDTAAKRSGRTQSQEAELRIDESFAAEPFGGVLRTLLLSVTLAFANRGRARARDKGLGDRPEDWIVDPDCYRYAWIGAVDSILASYPGDMTEEEARDLTLWTKQRIATAIANKALRRTT